MKIGELSYATGLSVDTIRFYERRGLIDETVIRRERNNYRNYTDDASTRLLMIKAAKNLGFSLKEISALGELWSSGTLDTAGKISILESKLRELERKKNDIARLERMITQKITRMSAKANAATA